MTITQKLLINTNFVCTIIFIRVKYMLQKKKKNMKNPRGLYPFEQIYECICNSKTFIIILLYTIII